MDWFHTYCAKSDQYRICTLPTGEDLYLVPIGNSNALFCGLDNEQHPFPDALGIKNDTADVEMLSGKFEKFNLYTWESYVLTYGGKDFLKIASVSRHVIYKI